MRFDRPLWIKICGITDAVGALAAQAAGADAVGFIFAASPRQVMVDQARSVAGVLKSSIARVGVFVDAPLEQITETAAQVGLTHIQLHGSESNDTIRALQTAGYRVIKSFRVGGSAADAVLPQLKDCPADAVLLDTYVPGQPGGTGKTFDWSVAARAAVHRPVILAGGLNPANVAGAVRTVRPFGIDVASGVERSPGKKDPAQVSSFVQLARHAWQSMVGRAAAEHREVMERVRNGA